MIESFGQMVSRSTQPMAKFQQSTLSRLLLSYVPLIDFMASAEMNPSTIASFGSGSCSHELFLSHAMPNASVYCHDVTDKYIPAYTRDEIIGDGGNIQFCGLDLEEDNARLYHQKFDFVFSIQTLEHIQNYRTFLELLASSVRPGGYLYLDAPYYHMEDDREDPDKLRDARARQWKENEHYYLGFSPAKLAQDPLLSEYEVVRSGYYSFHAGDQAVMRVFRTPHFAKSKGTAEFSIGMAYLMKSALDTKDSEGDLDHYDYFKKPATAFRMLLRKSG